VAASILAIIDYLRQRDILLRGSTEAAAVVPSADTTG